MAGQWWKEVRHPERLGQHQWVEWRKVKEVHQGPLVEGVRRGFQGEGCRELSAISIQGPDEAVIVQLTWHHSWRRREWRRNGTRSAC